jgi:hypothetical protein
VPVAVCPIQEFTYQARFFWENVWSGYGNDHIMGGVHWPDEQLEIFIGKQEASELHAITAQSG